jgi:hypothetical protein
VRLFFLIICNDKFKFNKKNFKKEIILCLSLFKENFIGNKQGLLQYFGPSSDHYQAKYLKVHKLFDK